MKRYTWLAGCVVAGLSATLILDSACGLRKTDELYCDGPGSCTEGYVCDVMGVTAASKGHGRTCVRMDQACDSTCANPTPVCRDVMVCEACTVNEECPADTPYCDGNGACVECLPDNTGCDASFLCNPDGVCVPRCGDDNDCSAPTPYCQDATYCVECLDSTQCTDGEICAPTGNCEPCTEHSQCIDSGICDELNGAGRCLTADEIVYVSNTEVGAEDMEGCGTGGNPPCQTIAYAVGQAQTQGRTWIHVDAGTYTGPVTISGGQTVRIIGEPGPTAEPAVVLEAAATVVLDVQTAGADVYIDGLAIQGGTLATVSCVDGKLRMYRSHVNGGTTNGVLANGCDLNAERVLVSNNSGTGILLSNASFALRNIVIIGNAGLGLRQIGTLDPQGILEFSTIVGNDGGGLSCDMPLTSVSHIILSNGAADADTEVGGCFTVGTMQDDYSLINGRDDINGLAADGYHLTANSPAVNAGMDPAPPGITQDFDGEPRPNGVIDIGADEYHPAGAR